MAVEYSVISIGTLSHNRLWGEGAAVRTSHATTTLVTDGPRRILVDPSLPEVALTARFNERTGAALASVTDVFCTTLRPVHRRSLEALAHAAWWCNETELETYGDYLKSLLASAQRLNKGDVAAIEHEQKVIGRFKPAPEQFTPQVQLYPLLGPSAGSAGLLLTPAASTILIAGDAALTAEHVLRGQVWEGCYDAQAAMDSLEDLLQVADVVICGHDNLMLTPQRW